MNKIGFIGLGVMGKSMAERLIENGNQLYIYTRTKSSADQLIERGCTWCDTPKEVADNCSVTISIVGEPNDVEHIYFGDNGLLSTENECILIDMTTSEPSLAKKIYEFGLQKDIRTLDAPVSGGDIGAKKGTLTIMVGGDEEVFNKCVPIFKAMGSNITYVGEAGSGQHTKMVNQVAIAGTVIGMVEAITYAKNANLDLMKTIEIISTGAAESWQLKNLAPKVVEKDYSPGFFIKHFVKDINIAIDECRRNGIDLPVLTLVESIYESLIQNGYGNLGTQALYKYYDLEDK